MRLSVHSFTKSLYTTSPRELDAESSLLFEKNHYLLTDFVNPRILIQNRKRTHMDPNENLERYLNNPFVILAGHVADLMIINVMWIIFSLPLITMGAATAAMYYATFRCVRKDETNPIEKFWHSFKGNLKQGTILTIIYLVYGGVVALDIYAARNGIRGVQLPEFYEMAAYVLLLPIAFTIAYIFPYLSRYTNTIKGSLGNSFLFSASHLDHTLLLLLMAAASIFICYVFPPVLLIVPALNALIGSLMIEKDFTQAEQIRTDKQDESEEETASLSDDHNEE